MTGTPDPSAPSILNPSITPPVTLSDTTWIDASGATVSVDPSTAQGPIVRDGSGAWTDRNGHRVTLTESANAPASSPSGAPPSSPAPSSILAGASLSDLVDELNRRNEALKSARGDADTANAALRDAQNYARSKTDAAHLAQNALDDAIDALIALAKSYDPDRP